MINAHKVREQSRMISKIKLNDNLVSEFKNTYIDTVHSPYLSLETFIEETELASHHLPIDFKRKLINFRNNGNDEGALLVSGLPIDPLLPVTPVVDYDVVENKKTFYSECWLSIIGHLLGEPFSYKQEGSGLIFHNVRPTKQNKKALSSESSDILLDFHTETAFHTVMPDYLLLFCLKDDRNKEAKTFLSSIRDFMNLIPKSTLDVLRQPVFKTGIDYSFGSENKTKGNGPIIPILYGEANDPLMTFDPDLMVGLTPEAEESIKIIKHIIDERKTNVLLAPGDLLIIDNHRAVHGRNKFKAYYDGQDRWLQRLYITRNLQRAEIIFSKRERIITHEFI